MVCNCECIVFKLYRLKTNPESKLALRLGLVWFDWDGNRPGNPMYISKVMINEAIHSNTNG